MARYNASLDRALNAEQKSRALFLSLLTKRQKDFFDKVGYVQVQGGKTRNVYNIFPGYSQNIRGRLTFNQLARVTKKDGPPCACPDCTRDRDHVICYHMRIGAPLWDHMAAQVLYIRFAEEVLLDEAYIS